MGRNDQYLVKYDQFLQIEEELGFENTIFLGMNFTDVMLNLGCSFCKGYIYVLGYAILFLGFFLLFLLE